MNERGAGRKPSRLVLHLNDVVMLNGMVFIVGHDGLKWRFVKEGQERKFDIGIMVVDQQAVTVAALKEQTRHA